MLNPALRPAAVFALACVLSVGSARAHAQTPAGQPAAPPSPAAAGVRDLPLTAAQRATYVGTYRVALPQGGTDTVRVFEEAGALRLYAGDEGRAARLLSQGAHVFHAEGVPDFVLTFAVDRGRATSFRVQKPDGTIDGTRVR